MPLHNTAPFVAASVRSVLDQTFPDWELLVVDDRSTDGSVAVVREAAAEDPRVMLTVNPGSAGAAAARNHGTDLARGRYIAFLDSDDLWLPAKLAEQIALHERTGAPLTYSSYFKIDAGEHTEATSFAPNGRIVRPPLKLTYRHMLRQDYVGFLTAMYDTEVLGKRRFPSLERRQDYAMLLEIFREGHVAHGLHQPLAIYRAGRAGSLSSNKLVAARYNWHLYRNVEALSWLRATAAFVNYAVRSAHKHLI